MQIEKLHKEEQGSKKLNKSALSKKKLVELRQNINLLRNKNEERRQIKIYLNKKQYSEL
ncbi:MAG: hypothetical protein GY707_07155 [Desulfobacteraceae bacterium]|nr:hypothetical protein [Desulfobacteraceae bacterium]